MRSVAKRPGAVILCLTLGACGVPPPRPSAPAGGRLPAESTPAVTAVGVRYRIDPALSELRVLVYRAGAMAALGHNHVICTRGLEGWATFNGTASGAAFAVTVPVADFLVDDPGRRMEEGAEFAEGVTDEARSGTARNMLGPAVLNAADHPTLTIRSVSVSTGSGSPSAGSGSLQARVALEVAGHASTLVVPFLLEISAQRLVAHGELAVRQSSIGLTPFSVFLGALRVQDELRVKFKFVAVRAGE